MKAQIKFGLVAILVVSVAVWGIWSLKFLPAAAKSTVRPVVAHSVQSTPVPSTLTIAAMKARGYEAGPVTWEQAIGDEDGYTASVFSFASDGFKQYGYWAQPSGIEPAGGWPVIIIVHGYIDPSQYNTITDAYTSWIAAWAKAGFVVIQPDLRGNGQSDGTAASGHWSPVYTYDIMNLVATLKADPSINAKHIGLVGHSMGGSVALNVDVISPDIAATVLVNGVVGSMYNLFYNWPNSPAPSDQPAAIVQAELSNLVKAHGTPKTDPTFWYQVSAINYVSGIQGPVQIDADTGDTTVPFGFSEGLDTALTAASKNVTFYSYPGDDHQLSNPGNLSLFLERSTAFFKQTL